MKFSIGYNHDIKLLDLLDIYKDSIEAFYFPMPYRYSASGRYIPQRDSYQDEIPKIIKKLRSLNISPQLLLNATCDGKFGGLGEKTFSRNIDYIQRLKDLGLESVIITNPVYISEVKRRIKNITVESSINCYVKTIEHALYLKDLGTDILTIDRDINRNIPLIKEIKKRTGLKIKMILNEGCLRNCPFRNMHYNYISHGVLKSDKFIDGIFQDRFCINIYLRHPEKILNIPFIPPDVLKYYTDFVDYYKLSTRTLSTARIETCLKAYKDGDFNGNLLEILDGPGLAYFDSIDYKVLKENNFFEEIIKCDNNCDNCDYCDRLMKKAIIVNSDFEASCYLELARTHFQLKNYEEAIKAACRVIDLNYKEGNVHFLLGASYEKLGQYKKAVEELKKAQEINPEIAEINFSLSNCYRNLSQTRLADKELRKSLLKSKDLARQI